MQRLLDVLKYSWYEFVHTPFTVKLAYTLLIAATILASWYLFFGGYLTGDSFRPDPNKAKEIQPFISGLVLPLLTLGSTLLVIANLRSSNIQNFSNNFFKLIDHHHRLVNNIDSEIEGYKATSKGQAFFDDLAARIAWDFEQLVSNAAAGSSSAEEDSVHRKFELSDEVVRACSDKTGKELLLSLYDHYYHLHQSDLGHYFRNLFHIVRFVDSSTIRKSLKDEYLKMLRAQLSNYELLLLAYNGMHDYGKEFYPLIEKYKLIKSLNNETRLPEAYEKRIVDLKILKAHYNQLAQEWKSITDNN